MSVILQEHAESGKCTLLCITCEKFKTFTMKRLVSLYNLCRAGMMGIYVVIVSEKISSPFNRRDQGSDWGLRIIFV